MDFIDSIYSSFIIRAIGYDNIVLTELNAEMWESAKK